MSREPCIEDRPLAFRVAEREDAVIRDAVLRITHTAFMINPATGLPIDGDVPTEVPMVEALFADHAIDHLHIACFDNEIAGYVLYARGGLTGSPGLRLQGLTIMGIDPPRQRQGIGSRLLLWSVEQMRGVCDLLFVLGHPKFYARAGFVPADSLGLQFSYPAPREACRVAILGERPSGPGVISYHPIVHRFF